MLTDAADGLDLSALSRESKVNLIVAELLGAEWEWMGLDDPTPFRCLRLHGRLVAADGDGLTRHPVRYFGPDYLNDPAAWGALCLDEHIDVRHHADGRVSARTADRFLDGKELLWMRPWSYAHSLPDAVCAAVRAKHNAEG